MLFRLSAKECRVIFLIFRIFRILAIFEPPQTRGTRISGMGVSTPQTEPRKSSQKDSNTSDGSEALFSMYLDRVIEEDRRMVESWNGDAEGMLTFVRLK